MTGVAAIVGGAVATVAIFLSLCLVGVGLATLEGIHNRVVGLPLVGGSLAGLVRDIESWFLAAARTVVTVEHALRTVAQELVMRGVLSIVETLTAPIAGIVNSLWGTASSFFTILTLAVLPPVEREIPAWLKHLDDEMKALPNEPAFRAGGPIRLVLQWLSDIWAVAVRLGPFIRIVAAPLLLILGLLWGLVELLGRLTRLETVQAGLVRSVSNLDYFRLQGEARLQQLAIAVNVLQTRAELLQVDLERERAARVAAATQEEQARHALQTALEGQRQADKAQWSPLLALAVLTALGAAGVDVLRKTAECDPCAQLDQELPGLSARVLQLETYGE